MKDYIINHPKAYLIIAANRGPDIIDINKEKFTQVRKLNFIKLELTGRVRAICFTNKDCEGFYNDRPMTQSAYKSVVSSLDKVDVNGNAAHFLLHLHDAIYHTHEHKIWRGYGIKLVEAISKTLLRGGQILC